MKLEKIFINKAKKLTAYSATDKQFIDWFIRELNFRITASNRLEIRKKMIRLLRGYKSIKER